MKILAFPGMGKTTLAKESGVYYDLDFDYVRKAHGFTDSTVNPMLLGIYADLANTIEEQGFTVLLNEPAVLGFNCTVPAMVLPRGGAIKRCARKLGVDEAQIVEWVHDWSMYAAYNDIAVLRTDKFLATEILPFETEPVSLAHKKRAFRK